MARLVVIDRVGNVVGVIAQTGISVMENIRDLDHSVEAICGGLCACATCHVLVDPGWAQKLPPRAAEELQLLTHSDAYDQDRSRLSCQIKMTEALDGLILSVAPEQF